jgi:16S rRNA processing protein RimM
MAMVGRIIRPHGNRGHVVVVPETDVPEIRFAPGSTLQVERDGRIEPITVAASRSHDGRWVVGFEGVPSIDAAETLRGMELRIPADALQPLGEGRYYTHDLVGCRVRTTTGANVGIVERVDLGMSVPMLVVLDGDEEVLLPFNDAICRRVSVADRSIEVDPPDGLIELNKRTRR